MSTLAGDVTFDFTFPSCDPTTPPSFSFDPSLLEIPYNPGHARSSSHGSVYSFESSPSDSLTASTRRTTPARSPIRTHGPLLLPKIRTQDQDISPSAAAAPAPKRMRTSPAPASNNTTSAFRPSHHRSYTSPDVVSLSSTLSFSDDGSGSPSLLCSPVSFVPPTGASAMHSRRASSCSVENAAIEKYGFPTYRHMPAYVPAVNGSSTIGMTPPQTHLAQPDSYLYQSYVPRAPSPLAHASLSPEPTPTTTLMSYLTSPNPAPALVRTVSFPLRDPHTKHFWWDIRQVRPWTSFNASSILSLPGASSILSCAVPTPLLCTPATTARHPETEQALHTICASYYLPKLNSALACSTARPLQLTVPPKTARAASSGMVTDCMFVANVAGEPASAATIFGGKPTARVVGLVKSFDRFNTGMRVEGNVKRVEYLRGLAHLHHAMREHGCRYGFIMTEIELVFVRNGTEQTPYFGYLEVGSVQLAAAMDGDQGADGGADQVQLTACLALWGLCMLAADEPPMGHAHWKAEVGAPAEGTRRKALPRDDWMPQPQLAEKREAKRVRGWVMPEDAVGRKELGKRGVRYGAC
ncbi:Sialidase [Coniochaeta hoffmannii]|uniref:Sialidase n=1 Tax=Coniochaeta hoffmannii TaxID=91930 RepID=A0AA38W090_9PEZI|nr:Sialidase [Coniochaeta hoffmannii]